MNDGLSCVEASGNSYVVEEGVIALNVGGLKRKQTRVLVLRAVLVLLVLIDQRHLQLLARLRH